MLAAFPAEDVATKLDSRVLLDTVGAGGADKSLVCCGVLVATGSPCELWAVLLCCDIGTLAAEIESNWEVSPVGSFEVVSEDATAVEVPPICWAELLTSDFAETGESWVATVCCGLLGDCVGLSLLRDVDTGDVFSVAPVALAVMGSTSTEVAVRDEVDADTAAGKALALAEG